MKNRPAYAIDSVDHALHLALLLQQEGPLGPSEAAERLGVARSTAHRLLAMLVYRDFAEQGEDRRYHAGPVLQRTAATPSDAVLLRRVAVPRMQVLVAKVNETCNLQVRVGTEVRFLESVECDRPLRVGDRAGRVLPAHEASGGKALLAALPRQEVARLYENGDSGVDLPALHRELALIRRRGYAINNQSTEVGVTAIGMLVPGRDDEPVAALTLAIPSARFTRTDVRDHVASLAQAVAGIHEDLTAESP